jgi:hypothetical protein
VEEIREAEAPRASFDAGFGAPVHAGPPAFAILKQMRLKPHVPFARTASRHRFIAVTESQRRPQEVEYSTDVY